MSLTDWHARSIGEVRAELDTPQTGLSSDEVRRRLARHGPNQLTPPPPVSVVEIMVGQFKSVIVALLAAAAAISLIVGDPIDAAAIAAVLFINTLIGFWTEWRADRSMEALLRLDVPHAFVVRESELQLIEARDLVPGDIVELRAGGRVPADARLTETTDLRLDEAALTGESLPVSKRADHELPADTPLADRRNMVYKSATVVAGLGRAVVTTTGAATEIGRIGVLVSEVHTERTPLERRLDVLGRRLVWLALGVAVLVSLLGALQGAPLALVLQTGIALAVAAVPEALPAVATIALAVGVWRMARRRALVRRLPAVEALGSTTVVCTDKTRTLTSGQMTVVHVWTPAGESRLGEGAGPGMTGLRARALLCAARASRPQAAAPGQGAPVVNDPVDTAMLRAAVSLNLVPADEAEPAAVLPFSSKRKLMAVYRRSGDVLVASVKGAPRRVLDRCTRAEGADGPHSIDGVGRHQFEAANETLARNGLRVLAVAEGVVSDPSESSLAGLTCLGLIGLADPPAPGVTETVARLRRAGLRTVMLTGDQSATAGAIGRQVGVLDADDRVADARELARCSAEEQMALTRAVNAFSRISPEDKLIVVRSLQASGEIVAMLGDGVNDAPALKRADVGVAMGQRGTDVAKQAADIVLQDDRFETVAAAVEEGRIIFDNIRKFVFYLFSCNVAEVFVLLGAGVLRLPLPLLPLQLLWLNLVTDTFPALALALEPGERNVMERPPRRPDAAILSRRFLGNILFYGGMITAATLAAYVWALATAPERATTVAFMTLALAQVAHLGNARSASAVLDPARAAANPYALLGVGISIGLQVLAISIAPLADILSLVPLTFHEWTFVILLSGLPAVVGQLVKLRQARTA